MPTLETAGVPLAIFTPPHEWNGVHKKAVEAACGSSGLAYIELASKGLDDLRLKQRVDREFFGRLGERLGIQDPMIVKDRYSECLEAANEAIHIVYRELPPRYRNSVGLLNGVEFYPESVAQSLRKMVKPGMDPTQRFERQRQYALAEVALSIRNGVTIRELKNDVSVFQDLFDEHVFSGPEGQTEPCIFYSFHDPETNKLIYISAIPNTDPGVNIKKHEFRARRVDGVGRVSTTPRIKSLGGATLKAVADSLVDKEKPGFIRGSKIEDSVGIMFVCLDDGQEAADRLQARLEDVLSKNIDGVSIKQEHNVDKGRGQSQNVKFNRIKVLSKGFKTPIELIIFTRSNYVNYRYDVGQPSEKEGGLYDGQAHTLFIDRRLMKIAPTYLFPPQYYPDFDVRSAIMESNRVKANELRAHQGLVELAAR